MQEATMPSRKLGLPGLAASSVACCCLLGSACASPGAVGTPPGTGGSSIAPGNGGSAGSGSGGNGGPSITLPPASSLGGAGGAATAVPPPVWPPPGYVNVTPVTYGDYALGPLLSSLGGSTDATGGASGEGGAAGTSSGNCGSQLFGLVRDFKMGTTTGGHPDFESPPMVDDRGIVTDTLGADGKPIYANNGGRTTSSQANFDQWYRDVPDVNMTYLIALRFVRNGTGNLYTFAAALSNPTTGGPGGPRGRDAGAGAGRDAGAALPDSSYFPLDGYGFDNQSQPHNFSFTTELHTSFTYSGGETFTFQGDDDVFVYINGHLAIDLGGIHNQETLTVNLDAQASTLGITTGNVYDLAVFNAERHTTQSNFRIDTTMTFTNCGVVNGIIY
jgi:fibro-slime domain-containing protein